MQAFCDLAAIVMLSYAKHLARECEVALDCE